MTIQQFRAARAFLGWSQQDLSAKSRVSRAAITNFEIGISTPQVRVMEALVAAFEQAGVIFLDADDNGGPGIRLKLGAGMPPVRAPGEDTATGQEGEGGMKSAWDDIEEATDADLDALLSEPSVPNPDMAELWRADPQAWERLSQIGRETLSRSMFGDCRAAAEGYFQSEHHAG